MKREDLTFEDYEQKHRTPNAKGSEALLARLIAVHGEEYAAPVIGEPPVIEVLPVVEEAPVEAAPVEAPPVQAVVWEMVEEDQGPILPTIREIKKHVSHSFRVRLLDLDSPRRQADVVRARQVAMYLCRTLTTRSYPEIGRRFGGRDHTTVLHAVHKIERLLSVDPVLAEQFNELKAKFA